MSAIGVGPSFWRRRPALDFAGALPPGATLTRASSASRFGPGGALVSEGADTARFDHDPGSHALAGLLLEGAGANLITSTLTAFSGGILASGAGDVTGGTSGWVFTATAASGNASHLVTGSSIGASVGASYSVSCFVKPLGATLVQIGIGMSTSSGFATFDLAAGAVVGTSAATGTIRSAGGGWWQVGMATVATGSGGNNGFGLAVVNSADATRFKTFAAGSDQAVQVCLPQCEQAGAVSSPIVAQSVPATRAADVLSLSGASLGAGDGPVGVRCLFDDGSTQALTLTVSGGVASVPVPLARPWLRRIERA